MRAFIFLLTLFFAFPAAAAEIAAPRGSGEVHVPLSDYTALLQQLTQDRRPAPTEYAIGEAQVSVDVEERDGQHTARVKVVLTIKTFEDEWALVPILPSGVALSQAKVDGQPVQLAQSDQGLAWSTAKAGTVTIELSYSLDATQSETAVLLPIPVPYAAATQFTMTLPDNRRDLAVVPAADLRSQEENGLTRYNATVPATSTILVSWRASGSQPYAVSRAHYEGRLKGDAFVLTGRLQVELFDSSLVNLPLLPNGATLSDVTVDGESATVMVQGDHFTTLLKGRGAHEIEVSFQVPVLSSDGKPHVLIPIPRIPVSRFDLVLPGQKELIVAPATNILLGREESETTTARFFIPMTNTVQLTWNEAVPEDLDAEVRATATLYHALHAEEGVLHGRGMINYEITRGETSLLTFTLPAAAQVNRVLAPAGGVSDWTESESGPDERKLIRVYLDRAISGSFLLEVFYERLMTVGQEEDDSITVPLLRALEVHRQRGMVALLADQELTLNPIEEGRLSRVGENQLPAFLRDQIKRTVAHTYKYIDPAPVLVVVAAVPERQQGIFDAQVDTLISLGEVAMKGSASIAIDVKSGTILDLTMMLPDGINVLGVTGPSLRSHQVRESNGGQVIAVEFTREMAGQFRLEVNYERIMDSAAGEHLVPSIWVADAEVEHGRIAIEALTAVEVRATRTERLSSLDLNELPQQLILKTTNPILLAYRYVQATPPIALVLEITRHREIEVQVAAIETAKYRSLFTRDGLAVTTARLQVRNSRRQFLRLALPAGSGVWSVFVDGKPEKPAFARAKEGETEDAILIRMINSTEGFPVEIVYATPVSKIDRLGQIASHLPRPDMVVTDTHWDVFLPVGPRYLAPDSEMEVVLGGRLVNPRLAGSEMLRGATDAQPRMGLPLRISVPTRGVHFAFEKLYANQSEVQAGFAIRYVSAGINATSLLISALGVGLLWLGILAVGSSKVRLSRQMTIAILVLGTAILLATIGYLGTSPLPASGVSVLLALAMSVWWLVNRIHSKRAERATD